MSVSVSVPVVAAAIKEIWDLIGQKVNVGLVGMSKSGKTSFAKSLSITDTTDITLENGMRMRRLKVEKRKINGKNYKIRFYDTDGDKEYHSANMKFLIENNTDLYVFFCRLNDFLNDNEYRRQVFSRLKHINSFVDNKESVVIVLNSSDMSNLFENLQNGEDIDPKISKKVDSLFIDKEYKFFRRIFLNMSNEMSVETILMCIPPLFPIYNNL